MSTEKVRRWALTVPHYRDVNPSGRASSAAWKERQRECVRSTRAVVAAGAPCTYGLIAGLLSLTSSSADQGMPRYVAGLLMEIPLLMVAFVILCVIYLLWCWITDV